jgi:outer membrane protein assembly factor BamE (lipoprotein component of BamABCDE complex)
MRNSIWLGAVLGATLAACATMSDVRGNLPDEERLGQVRPGITKESVQQILGTPSSVGTFDDNTWYYISKKTEQWAFKAPKMVEQQVIAVDFDQNGRVRDVRRHGKEEAMAVDPVDRTTPTPGKELGFFEQLFGNLGRFNTPQTRNAAKGP